MRSIELPGGTAPIPVETWSGRLGHVMTAHEMQTPTFPISDGEVLVKIGRPRLAALLVEHGLLSDEPTIAEPISSAKADRLSRPNSLT